MNEHIQQANFELRRRNYFTRRKRIALGYIVGCGFGNVEERLLLDAMMDAIEGFFAL